MGQFQFQTVPNIIAGLGSIERLKQILIEQKSKNCYWLPIRECWLSSFINLF